MRVRVKICGITSTRDAIVAAQAGADAIGIVFAPSPRRVSVDKAREIVLSLPPMITAVGVFVDAPLEEVTATAGDVGLHTVQLHGSESPEYISRLGGLSVLKAIRIASEDDVKAAEDYGEAAILLDTKSPQGAGGTGETFPWEYARGIARQRPVVLAGGLCPDNVAEAIRAVHPWGIDVSSGVEKEPGVKDPDKVREFIDRAGRAEDETDPA